MRITHAHVEFWEQKQPCPGWVQTYRKKQLKYHQPKSQIDKCVNAHAGVVTAPGENDAYNLLSILRSMRKRMPSVLAELDKIAINPGTIIRPLRRAAFARKWAKRIRKRTSQ